MISGINFEQGKILLANVPFTNLQETKKRPVLVISNDEFNNSSEDIIVLSITSNLTNKVYSVPIDNSSLSNGQLPRASLVKVNHIWSLSKTIVTMEIGSVKSTVLTSVITELVNLL